MYAGVLASNESLTASEYFNNNANARVYKEKEMFVIVS